MSDPVDSAWVTEGLVAPIPGPVVWVAQTGSTNDLIALRARDGAPEGLVIGADVQTRGRGRQGRAWEASVDDAVLLSILVRPDPTVVSVGVLPIVAAVGVTEGLATLGIAADIVWPNDVSVEGRKLGGILCELSSSAGTVSWGVIGIGINVHAAPVLSDARWVPVSCAELVAETPTRSAVVRAVVAGVGACCARWYAGQTEEIIAAFAARDLLRDQEIEVQVGNNSQRGCARGIDAAGRLQLELAGGECIALTSAEVTRIIRPGH
jgi:BirA family biotin operon repressor/biotin-[acetyl-CoA-carboxylase] ligase